MIVFLNNRLLPKSQAKISVFDHGFLYGDGIYETLRTNRGQVWQPQLHLQRLRHSAKLINLNIPWKNSEILSWINQTIQKNEALRNPPKPKCAILPRPNDHGLLAKADNFPESRIRLTITRGENNFSFSHAKKPSICIIVQKLTPEPKNIYQKGVPVIAFPVERILPAAKTINLIPNILARQATEKKKAYEALLVNHQGFVTEGTITNFFIVKNKTLITPCENVLPGTTRNLILKIAKPLCPIELRNIKKSELYTADECFISNAPKGIIPVIKIDKTIIKKGRVGPLTAEIQQKFNDLR